MDDGVLRLLVVCLAGICALCVGGVVICDVAGHAAPQMLGTIGGVTSGALVGILVNPYRQR